MGKSSNFFGHPIYGQLIKPLDREKIIEMSRNVIEYGADVTVKSPNVIVNSKEFGTNDTNNDEVGINDGTNISAIGTNHVSDGSNDGRQRKEAIIDMMRKNKRVSVKEISEALKIPRRTLFRIIDVLKSENRIKRVGELKSGTWEVVK